jgi:hypothetical protein
MRITQHAVKRMQQRAINQEIVHWLESYGQRIQTSSHCVVVILSRRARKRLAEEVGPTVYAQVEKKLDAYLVVRGGQIITVGYRYKHIRKH